MAGEKIRDERGKVLQHKKEKRESIMNAALKVFSKKGYSPAALDEVATEAGIAKGTLYLYFSDKEDLFCSTIIYVMNRLRIYLVENLRGERDPLKLLKKVIYHFLEFFVENTSFFSLIEVAVNENIVAIHKKLRDVMIKRRKEFYEFLGSVFDRGVEIGVIREDITRDDFIVSVDGIIRGELRRIIFENMKRKQPIRVDVSERANSVYKILTEGIQKK